MRFRSPNIIFVCLLAITTLWLSQTAAAHIHLDNDKVNCQLCLSSGTGDSTLESTVQPLQINVSTTEIVAVKTIHPKLTPVAPRNSRAPPAL